LNTPFRKLNVPFPRYRGCKTLLIAVRHAEYFLSLWVILFQGYLNTTEEIPAKPYTWTETGSVPEIVRSSFGFLKPWTMNKIKKEKHNASKCDTLSSETRVTKYMDVFI
jgi:hypothetical protein